MVLRHIQGLVDVTWQFLLALQEVDQLENAFAIDATLVKHHFTVDTRVVPMQTQDRDFNICFSGSGSWCS